MKKEKPMYYAYTSKSWFRKNWTILFILFSGVVLLHLFLFAETFQGNSIDSVKAGNFGDFLGGYIGSFFSLISILLLYVTLRDQRNNFALEKFENRLFQMLAHHEHNVTELGLDGAGGKKIFVSMIKEYRFIYYELKKIVKKNSLLLSPNAIQSFKDNKTFMAFSYIIFFFGIGSNSSRILKAYLKKDFAITDNFIVALFAGLDRIYKSENKPNRKPVVLAGHQSQLGDYYRHLYQMVKYVDLCKLDINKYEYVKIIRAQLSNHEQALLLINSFSSLGREWTKKDSNYIITYKFVSNIPDSFFDPDEEIDISNLFTTGYFEYEK